MCIVCPSCIYQKTIKTQLREIQCFFLLLISFFLFSCNSPSEKTKNPLPDQFILVLGLSQDAGFPQAGCSKECCRSFWQAKSKRVFVSSLAIIEPKEKSYWLIDCGPDIKEQIILCNNYFKREELLLPKGIFLTHAHIGHYSGLMHFGMEAMDSRDIPVYVLPRMKLFIENSGPWSQLVERKNIVLKEMKPNSRIRLENGIEIVPFLVPHRDEYSETCGFEISSKKKKVVFLPDIDKWKKWDVSLSKMVSSVNIAYLDGTFYSGKELPGRDMNEIQHPLVLESMELLQGMESLAKQRVRFIHFNHTNPLLNPNSQEFKDVQSKGFGVARQGEIFPLD
jgi:pyrroloquinoline quinone biosynthesis protein B